MEFTCLPPQLRKVLLRGGRPSNMSRSQSRACGLLYLVAKRGYAIHAPGAPTTLQVFNRNTKWLQKERAAADPQASRNVDYLKDEVASRLCERLLVRLPDLAPRNPYPEHFSRTSTDTSTTYSTLAPTLATLPVSSPTRPLIRPTMSRSPPLLPPYHLVYPNSQLLTHPPPSSTVTPLYPSTPQST